jgi:hypothetical protein
MEVAERDSWDTRRVCLGGFMLTLHFLENEAAPIGSYGRTVDSWSAAFRHAAGMLGVEVEVLVKEPTKYFLDLVDAYYLVPENQVTGAKVLVKVHEEPKEE